jgi:tRNA1(Val) A37 N6-methylase TrmN6
VIYPFDREGGLLELADKYQLFPNRQLYIKGTELKVPNRLIVEFSFSKKEVVKSELIVRISQTNDYTVEYKKFNKGLLFEILNLVPGFWISGCWFLVTGCQIAGF